MPGGDRVPPWLHGLAVASLVTAAACALTVVVDLLRGHRQRMWIMNVVWPLTMLWAGPLGLLAYFAVGRRNAGADPAGSPAADRPFWQSVGIAASHCGGGCTLGDLLAESLTVAVPISVFGSHVFGTWALDFAFAFVLGIAFQYFTIAPMRDLTVRDGLVAAVKADALSLTAWQVGMYGWMALALFVFSSESALRKSTPAFWFMMQLAMAAGFLTSYPVNWWLLRTGRKETM